MDRAGAGCVCVVAALAFGCGAILFGGVTIMQLAGQAKGWTIPPQFLSMLPYLATIFVLVFISSRGRNYFGAPANLGRVFHPTR